MYVVLGAEIPSQIWKMGWDRWVSWLASQDSQSRLWLESKAQVRTTSWNH